MKVRDLDLSDNPVNAEHQALGLRPGGAGDGQRHGVVAADGFDDRILQGKHQRA